MTATQFDQLVQGSPAWLEFRQRHVGSSEVPTIMWLSPFGETPFKLWQAKVHGAKPQKTWDGDPKAHGIEHEAAGRDAAAEALGDFYAPTVVQCGRPGLEMLIASLDGANHDLSEIMEVKAPLEIGTHLQAKEGRLDDHYYAQVQAQLLATGAKVCHFFTWFGEGELARVDVYPDDPYQYEIAARVREFWSWVERREFPFPQGEMTLEGSEYEVLAERYAKTIADMRAVENRQRELKARLLGLRPGIKKLQVGPLEVVWTHRRGYTEKQLRTVPESLSVTIRRVK